MFAGLVALRALDLSHNHISIIEAGTFAELGDCGYLILNNNALVHLVPGMFKGLGALYSLGIKRNKIKIIEPRTFTDLRHCRHLILESNDLNDLKAGMFTGLKSLQELDLSNNNIADDSFLGYFRPLVNNTMHLQPEMFSGLKSLVSLKLQRNRISFIGCKTFANLTNLEYLHLSHNSLSTLERNVFGPTLQEYPPHLSLSQSPGV